MTPHDETIPPVAIFARNAHAPAFARAHELFGDDLAPPDRAKTRELCERLYPELLAA